MEILSKFAFWGEGGGGPHTAVFRVYFWPVGLVDSRGPIKGLYSTHYTIDQVSTYRYFKQAVAILTHESFFMC